jgi:L-threonylcarbamoyladenylate synthase
MSAAQLSAADAARLERCVSSGGVAVFPTDTVYGVCCDPESRSAARRLYELKGRPADRPAAVMFFAVEQALQALPELHDSERLAVRALLPGQLTLLLPNRGGRFAPACGPGEGALDSLGLRVPRLPERTAALASLSIPVMQSSANLSGAPDARSLSEVPDTLLHGAELVLDGGELPGTPSTVLDLRSYALRREWHVLREGAVPTAVVVKTLESLDPV